MTKMFLKAQNLVVVYEGLHTYGGLAGRDMEAMAQGIREAVSRSTMAARIGQVRYLGRKLEAAGVPIVRPIGSHAIFIDARASCRTLTRTSIPAQALAAELFIEAGIRTWSAATCPPAGTRYRGEPPAQTGTGPTDHSSARLHAGAHGCRRGSGLPTSTNGATKYRV